MIPPPYSYSIRLESTLSKIHPWKKVVNVPLQSYLDVQIRTNGIARCDTDESDEGSLLDLPAVSTTDDILMSCLAVSMDGRVWYAHYGGISEPQAPSVGHRKCFYTYSQSS